MSTALRVSDLGDLELVRARWGRGRGGLEGGVLGLVEKGRGGWGVEIVKDCFDLIEMDVEGEMQRER